MPGVGGGPQHGVHVLETHVVGKRVFRLLVRQRLEVEKDRMITLVKAAVRHQLLPHHFQG